MEVGFASQEPVENVLEVRGDIEVVADGAADQRHQICRTISGHNTTDYEPDGMTFSEKMLLGLSSDSRKALTRRRDIHEAI
jgi:hypothetical protein